MTKLLICSISNPAALSKTKQLQIIAYLAKLIMTINHSCLLHANKLALSGLSSSVTPIAAFRKTQCIMHSFALIKDCSAAGLAIFCIITLHSGGRAKRRLRRHRELRCQSCIGLAPVCGPCDYRPQPVTLHQSLDLNKPTGCCDGCGLQQRHQHFFASENIQQEPKASAGYQSQ